MCCGPMTDLGPLRSKSGMGRPHIGFTCPHCGEPVIPDMGETIALGRLQIDTAARRVIVDGKPRHVQAGRQWLILVAMAKQPGRLFTAENLMNVADLWECESNHLAVLMSKIRRVVGDVIEIRSHKFIGYSLHVRGEESVA